MHQACSGKGFMEGDDGTLLGLKLGFDFCAEHEQGTARLARRLGVPHVDLPIGITDRLVQPSPAGLVFEKGVHTFPARRASRRGPAVKALKVPTATLAMPDSDGMPANCFPTPSDPTTSWHDPERDWLYCAWDCEEFGVQAVGEKNVTRLERLHQAFLSGDVAMGLPWSKGFLRGGLTFVIASAVGDDDREAIKARDLDHKHLIDSVAASGIEQELAQAGRKYFALAPDWADEGKTQLRFFLNPCWQDRHNHGWFDLADLRDWKEGRGVVMGGTLLDTELKRLGCGDVCRAFEDQLRGDGYILAEHSKCYWAKGRPGAGEPIKIRARVRQEAGGPTTVLTLSLRDVLARIVAKAERRDHA